MVKSRKENPQKLTQFISRSHPRHLVGKRTAQKDTIIGITSDSQVNSNFPYRWSPASLTFNNSERPKPYCTQKGQNCKERPKFYTILAFLSAIGLTIINIRDCPVPPYPQFNPVLFFIVFFFFFFSIEDQLVFGSVST